ncbi:MAG TPA: hypothetical protein VF725_15440 [Ktedonobacterales bacterium]
MAQINTLGFFRFLFTPLLLMFTTAWVYRTAEHDSRAESKWAFWLGVFVAILVIVLNLLQHLPTFLAGAFEPFSPNGIEITADLIFGFLSGVGSMVITQMFDGTRRSLVVIAAVTAACLLGLYFDFVSGSSDNIMIFTLCFVIGAIAARIFGPK